MTTYYPTTEEEEAARAAAYRNFDQSISGGSEDAARAAAARSFDAYTQRAAKPVITEAAPPITPGAPAASPPSLPFPAAAPATATAPTMMQTGQTSGGSRQRVEPTKAEAGLLKEDKRLAGEEADVAARAGDLKIQQGEDVVEQSRREAAERSAQVERLQQEQAQLNGEIAKRQAGADEARNNFKNAKIEDYFADKSTAFKIASILFSALGNYASARGGGKNIAGEMLEKAMNTHMALQQQKILKLKEEAGAARDAVGDARVQKADQLLDLKNREAAAWGAIEADWRAKLATAGVPAAEIEKDATLVSIRKRENKSLLEYEQGLRARVTSEWGSQRQLVDPVTGARPTSGGAGGRGGNLTEGQSKNADIAGRMLNDQRIMDDLGPMSKEGIEKLRKLAPFAAILDAKPEAKAALVAANKWKEPEEILSDRDRQVYQAQKRFAASTLRGDSGASIAFSEYMTFESQHFARPGDKDADLAQKRQARGAIVQGKLRGAGPAAADVLRQAGSAPASPAAPAPGGGGEVREFRNKQTGQMVRARMGADGKWYPIQ